MIFLQVLEMQANDHFVKTEDARKLFRNRFVVFMGDSG